MESQIVSKINSEHFQRYGYEIINSSLREEYEAFHEELKRYFLKSIEKLISKKVELDHLKNYHRIIDEYDIDHHSLIQGMTRKLPDIFHNTIFIKQIIKSCEKFIGEEIKITDDLIWFRICRPQNDDSNDLHRDHWFPNYLDVLNLYIPIAGSYSDSAMKVVPKSHKWSEDEVVPTFSGDSGQKYVKNGVAYSAPGVKYCKYPIKEHRPDVKLGDFMIFNPKCIHGGGDNFSEETRISLEIRIQL